MRVTATVRAQVKATIEKCIVTANAHYDYKFKYPTVIYKKRGRVAGTACDSTYTIDLNSVLLMENVESFLKSTVIHEFAHLVDGIINPTAKAGRWGRKRDIHGPRWQNIMRLLGGPTSRCHSYDTTNSKVKKRGQTKHVWTCSCGAGTMKIGAKRQRKMLASNGKQYWMRGHKGYGHSYSYFGVEGAELPPMPILKAASAPKPAPKRRTELTKMAKCRLVFDPELNKDQNVVAFIEEGCTPAGASTYYYNILREF